MRNIQTFKTSSNVPYLQICLKLILLRCNAACFCAARSHIFIFPRHKRLCLFRPISTLFWSIALSRTYHPSYILMYFFKIQGWSSMILEPSYTRSPHYVMLFNLFWITSTSKLSQWSSLTIFLAYRFDHFQLVSRYEVLDEEPRTRLSSTNVIRTIRQRRFRIYVN